MRSSASSRYVLPHVGPRSLVGLLLLLAGSSIACSHDNVQPGTSPSPGLRRAAGLPPNPSREFRGIFVATAYNLDWPSRPGLHPRVLSDEIRAVVGRAKDLRCNVIILQVRAFGDRMHRDTRLRRPEPWSAALNPGDDRDPDKKPKPDYDPLGDWITQCHAAGIELHAWVNPFRVDRIVRDAEGKPFGLLASEDFNTVYLDYSQTNVQDYVIDVVDDLLKYRSERPVTVTTPGGGMLKAARRGGGIDGLLFDHNLPHDHGGTSRPTSLFSAPPRYTQHQLRIQWLAKKCAQPTGPKHLDDFIQRVSRKVHGEHGLKFGISPARDDTASIDWLKNGWVNYIIPELYFKEAPGTVQKGLTKWLDNVRPQSGFTPIVIAGLFVTRTQSPKAGSDDPWSGKDIADQISETRRAKSRRNVTASGEAHYSWGALRAPCCGGPIDPQGMENTLGELLKNRLYLQPALVPQCTAPRGDRPPDAPLVSLTNGTVSWRLPTDSKTDVLFWAVWTRERGPRSSGWAPMQLFDGSVTTLGVLKTVDRVAVKAIDRHNRESAYGLAP